jgi:hypothetical protein
MSRAASFAGYSSLLVLALSASIQAEPGSPKLGPAAPASAAPAPPMTAPSTKPAGGVPAPIVEFPHAIHTLAVQGEQLFFTHAQAEKGFKSDPRGVSKASIGGGAVSEIWRMGKDRVNPSRELGVTKDWVYLTMELNYWDTSGSLFRIPVAGGPSAELSRALVRQAFVNERAVVWLEGKAEEQASTLQVMAHDGAPKVLATFPETVILKALTDNEVLFTSSKLSKTGTYDSTLHAISSKDARKRVLLPKLAANHLVVFGKEVIVSTPYGQVVAHPLAGGAARTLLGKGGSCGAQGAIKFTAGNGYLYWADLGTLKRCPLAGGKAEVLGSVPPSVNQLVATDTRLFAVASESGDGPSLIFRYDLP